MKILPIKERPKGSGRPNRLGNEPTRLTIWVRTGDQDRWRTLAAKEGKTLARWVRDRINSTIGGAREC